MGGKRPAEGEGESGSAWLSKDPANLARREGNRVRTCHQNSLTWPAVLGRTVQEKRERARVHMTGRMETWEEGTSAARMWGLVATCTTGQTGKAPVERADERAEIG